MLKRLDNDLDWHAMEVCAASDLHCKQRPDEALQEYIQKFTDLTEKAMGIDCANITNSVIIFLSLKTYATKIYHMMSSC